MLTFAFRKVAQTLVVLFIVSVACFSLLKQAPGDPVEMSLGSDYSPEAHAALVQQLGLDRPLYEQYLRWAGDFVTGDWGNSFVGRAPIFGMVVLEALPVTLLLASCSLFLALALGVPLGVLAAVRRGSIWDSLSAVYVLTNTSFPSFYLGILLIWGFGVHFQIFPVMGYVSPLQDPLGALWHMALPAITLSAYFVAMIMRVTRAGMVEAMSQPYVAAARARGEPARRVVWVHAMRNVLLPLATVVGLQIGQLIQGAVLTETVFSLPGMGQLITRAVLSREYGVVQAGVMTAALIFVVVNLVIDLLYPLIDPRLRSR
ncbi:ABC transporter permease [Camelimonas abortus]|uniref:ABC transporter permease n=1 Tax=Camelimonas abortus TaxID=1017184 RepID=A0ABV7LCH7_9HYPH